MFWVEHGAAVEITENDAVGAVDEASVVIERVVEQSDVAKAMGEHARPDGQEPHAIDMDREEPRKCWVEGFVEANLVVTEDHDGQSPVLVACPEREGGVEGGDVLLGGFLNDENIRIERHRRIDLAGEATIAVPAQDAHD